ncbi:MAG TPA: TolC family protein [Candidatus Cybelea sp.]|jgi:HAE1 family hydrophobic/amphiphilic exporter-1|nr:TolC family protein [Candidatus Cybelea sp.]
MLRTRTLSAGIALAALVAAVVPVQRISAEPDDALPARATIPTAMPTVAMPVVPSVAPGYAAPQVAPSAALIVGVTQSRLVNISLQDAIAMSLLKNPNLAVSASNVKVARYQITQAKGQYDVQLHLEPSSSYSVTPPENLFEAGPGEAGKYTPGPEFTTGPGDVIQHQSTFQYGVGGQTENGTTYQAGIQQQRTYNNTIFDEYNPYYLATLNLGVTQPLLKNAGMNAGKRLLKLSFINADASSAQALIDSSNTISQVEDAYWNLVAAWRNVAIQEEALHQAVLQRESATRLAKRGAVAPIAVVESQTQVATFQDDVFSALQTVSLLQNQLKSLIVADPADPIWQANLVPSSSVAQAPSANDLATIQGEARANRPEYRQAEDKRLQADLDRAYAKNQMLPQADVQALYLSNGFAGILTPTPAFLLGTCTAQLLPACPTPPPNTQGKMAFAYHNMWAGAFPTFNIALVVNYPIQNRYARGLQGAAGEEIRQAALLLQGVEERIAVEARNGLQSYQSSLSRLSAARSARESAEAVYASEVRKFHNGESTTFLVLQRQVQLAQARGLELRAQTQLNESIAELQRVEGTTFRINGVNLQTLGTQALPQK